MIGGAFRRGVNAMARSPRRAYGEGSFGRGWRRHITDRERRAALASLERDRGVYSFERDIRGPLSLGLAALALAPAAAETYQRARGDPLRDDRRELARQRRLLEALRSELSVAFMSDPNWLRHLDNDGPRYARDSWGARFDNRERQRLRNQRMREVISELDGDYAGYSGRDAPEMGLVFTDPNDLPYSEFE